MRRFLILWLILPFSLACLAETAVVKGSRIAREVELRDTGWQDQASDMIMTLRNRQGDQSRREIRTRTLEMKNDGDKSLTIFDTPRDVKGTAFLSFIHALKTDDQWLHLPALKR